jgi:RNA polymerase sigma factor (sigma-70 family)
MVADRVANLAVKIADLCAVLEEKKAAVLSLRTEIEAAIRQLEPFERRLIRLRYVSGLRWEKIALKLNYSWRQVYRTHSSALEKMALYGTKSVL